MKLSEAQKLAEEAIYDYTSSSKWQQVKYMTWTTAEVQDVIAKALVKNFELTAVVQAKPEVCEHKNLGYSNQLYTYCLDCKAYLKDG